MLGNTGTTEMNRGNLDIFFQSLSQGSKYRDKKALGQPWSIRGEGCYNSSTCLISPVGELAGSMEMVYFCRAGLPEAQHHCLALVEVLHSTEWHRLALEDNKMRENI